MEAVEDKSTAAQVRPDPPKRWLIGVDLIELNLKAGGLLNLDIDSWDYFVLEEILAEFRPQLAIVEVNRLIPAS
jgi:hypothetical protein